MHGGGNYGIGWKEMLRCQGVEGGGGSRGHRRAAPPEFGLRAGSSEVREERQQGPSLPEYQEAEVMGRYEKITECGFLERRRLQLAQQSQHRLAQASARRRRRDVRSPPVNGFTCSHRESVLDFSE
jgi:hypothetical protein